MTKPNSVTVAITIDGAAFSQDLSDAQIFALTQYLIDTSNTNAEGVVTPKWPNIAALLLSNAREGLLNDLMRRYPDSSTRLASAKSALDAAQAAYDALVASMAAGQ